MRRQHLHIVVKDCRTKTRQWPADRVRPTLTGRHRQEGMQHFGRANAVDQ
jgi:hypothetical protein